MSSVSAHVFQPLPFNTPPPFSCRTSGDDWDIPAYWTQRDDALPRHGLERCLQVRPVALLCSPIITLKFAAREAQIAVAPIIHSYLHFPIAGVIQTDFLSSSGGIASSDLIHSVFCLLPGWLPAYTGATTASMNIQTHHHHRHCPPPLPSENQVLLMRSRSCIPFMFVYYQPSSRSPF